MSACRPARTSTHPRPTSALRVVPAMSEVGAAAWDACANPQAGAFESQILEPARDAQNCISRISPTIHSFPTISCTALEASGSATARTGWQPQHLWSKAPDGGSLGAVPCYLKSHSRGEYVFDRGWAEAYERAGGSTIPKLQVSVPFTPATGRRLLVRPGARGRADPRRARRGPDRTVPPPRGLVGARHVPARAGMPVPGRARLPAAHRPAVPLGERRLRQFRRVPRGAVGAQAQDHPPRAARGARARHHRALAHRLAI